MDHLVSMPTMLDASTRTAISTLALAGSFASPSHQSAPSLESDLLTRFSATASLDATSVIAWLESAGMSYQDLDPLVAQIATTIVPLHTAMQSQIDAQGVVLLQVANASLLMEAPPELSADAPADAPVPAPVSLHPGDVSPLWLVRSGYSTDKDFGYYYDLSAYGYTQPVHILWSDVLASGITAAIALNAPVPPKPPVDVESAANALHIAEQAMVTMQSAIDSFKTALQVA